MRTCKLLCLLALFQVSWTTLPIRKIDKAQCVPVTEIPLCAAISGYKNFHLPNFKNQTLAEEANEELSHFYGLIKSECSTALGYLLCAVYAPLCYTKIENNNAVIAALPPCRHLCEHAIEGCADTVKKQNETWPPGPHLSCSRYPASQPCFAPRDLSILTHLEVPEIKVPKPMACETISIGPSSATITLGSNSTRNEATLPVTSVKCSLQAANTSMNGSSTIQLTGLETDTEYNCTVQQNVSDDVYACQVQFRTLELLDIKVINDTPNVTNGTIALELTTNRPAATIECQLLTRRDKLDCSTGHVQFTGIPHGYYTVRILAKNSETDRATLRVRVRVPMGPTHCAVNLINRQWKLEGQNVTVWFKALGPDGTTMRCCVTGPRNGPRICTINCSSPYRVSQLERGENKIKLTPGGRKCSAGATPRTIKITV